MRKQYKEKPTRYKVVKVMRVSMRRKIIKKNISDIEEAKRIVKSYPDSKRSMVVFMSY